MVSGFHVSLKRILPTQLSYFFFFFLAHTINPFNNSLEVFLHVYIMFIIFFKLFIVII